MIVYPPVQPHSSRSRSNNLVAKRGDRRCCIGLGLIGGQAGRDPGGLDLEILELGGCLGNIAGKGRIGGRERGLPLDDLGLGQGFKVDLTRKPEAGL